MPLSPQVKQEFEIAIPAARVLRQTGCLARELTVHPDPPGWHSLGLGYLDNLVARCVGLRCCASHLSSILIAHRIFVLQSGVSEIFQLE